MVAQLKGLSKKKKGLRSEGERSWFEKEGDLIFFETVVFEVHRNEDVQ